ncbi:MAG TPA: HisA/HisF-related TIM barrel protein, partial [Anditalea sp.]|nr:HisA/HisF-related TIM barrel protein [Anditalea sp.]
MLTKRIIPCLDIKEGRTVKGINFVELKDAGDPVELAKIYSDEGADELVFLDITATVDKRKTLVELVTKVAKAINIPFTVGGGISTIEDVKALLIAGADKISINSAAVKNPGIIDE